MSAPPAAIVGCGRTDYSRHSGRTPTRLAAEAIIAACADAGITPKDLDGVIPYVLPPTAEDIAGMFGLGPLRFNLAPRLGGASAVAALEAATMALQSGLATYVVAFVSRNGASGQRAYARGASVVPGQQLRSAFEVPHGLQTPAQWYALLCRRHMHEFGTTRAQLGRVALTMRENAQRNPHAMMYGRELTMDQYLAARVISDPYHLFDCALETDGAAAVVLTTSDRAGDSPHPPVLVAGAASARSSSPDNLYTRSDPFETGLRHAAPAALRQAAVELCDIDIAMIYDCFTFEVIHQLEEAGFCAHGDGGAFLESGATGRDGSLPVNPHGGLLSEGHIGGISHVIEAVAQLRGTAGAGQIRTPDVVAVTGWGDLADGAFAVLTRGTPG